MEIIDSIGGLPVSLIAFILAIIGFKLLGAAGLFIPKPKNGRLTLRHLPLFAWGFGVALLYVAIALLLRGSSGRRK